MGDWAPSYSIRPIPSGRESTHTLHTRTGTCLGCRSMRRPSTRLSTHPPVRCLFWSNRPHLPPLVLALLPPTLPPPSLPHSFLSSSSLSSFASPSFPSPSSPLPSPFLCSRLAVHRRFPATQPQPIRRWRGIVRPLRKFASLRQPRRPTAYWREKKRERKVASTRQFTIAHHPSKGRKKENRQKKRDTPLIGSLHRPLRSPDRQTASPPCLRIAPTRFAPIAPDLGPISTQPADRYTSHFNHCTIVLRVYRRLLFVAYTSISAQTHHPIIHTSLSLSHWNIDCFRTPEAPKRNRTPLS